MGVQSLLKSCLQILSMCHCNLVWVSCLELSVVEYTQKVQTAKQQGQLQAVICSSAPQLAKDRCQKGNSFSHLPHLCQSLGEAADSSVRYGQTSSQSFTFPFLPLLPSYGKNVLVTGPELCLQDMKSSAAGGCNITCQVPKESSSKC